MIQLLKYRGKLFGINLIEKLMFIKKELKIFSVKIGKAQTKEKKLLQIYYSNLNSKSKDLEKFNNSIIQFDSSNYL